MSEAIAAMTTRFSQPGASRTRAREVHWWVIVRKQKTLQLHLLSLSTTQTGVTVIHDLRKKYDSTNPTRHWWHAEPTVAEAFISPVSPPQIVTTHMLFVNISTSSVLEILRVRTIREKLSLQVARLVPT
jgi:hypothetical protein